MIDTHCHLNLEPLEQNYLQLITDAQVEGVTQFIVPGISVASSLLAISLSKASTKVFAAVGIHPLEVASEQSAVKEIEVLLKLHPEIVAVGEVGLDFKNPPHEAHTQLELFRQMLELASAAVKPVIVHTRAAHLETMSMLAKYPKLSVLIHSFSGSIQEADDFVQAGYLLSVNGIITFKNNDHLRETVKNIPLDRIVLETDAPYLAPEGFRGKDNYPANIIEVAKCLADIKGMTVDAIDQITTDNATRFFALPV